MVLNRIRNIVSASLLLIAIGFATSAKASVDYTDIWYAAGGAESGWGVNMAHTNVTSTPSTQDFIFATFFIYGPDGQPFWYAAELFRTSTTSEIFTGVMYRVKGTWFGAATFPPVKAADVTVVGDATFTATSSYAGTLRYRVDAVNVNKNIERQTTTPLVVQDIYIGGIAGSTSGNCGTTPATFRNTSQFRLVQTAATQTAPGTLRIEFYGADSTNVGVLICFMQGNVTQHGKVLNVTGGNYQCSTGLNTSVEIDSVRLLDAGVEAHWRANIGGVAGCTESGRLSGVKQ